MSNLISKLSLPTFAQSIALGLSLAAVSISPALAVDKGNSAVNSKADCEYEGGSVFNISGATVCLVQIRPEDYRGEEYDGQQLGVESCSGETINNGLFCKVTLVPAPPKAAPAALETEVDADVMTPQTAAQATVQAVDIPTPDGKNATITAVDAKMDAK